MGIVKDSGYLVATNVSNLIAALLTGVLTARFLGAEGRGELYLVIQVATLGSLLLGLGLGPSYQYHLTRKAFGLPAILLHGLVHSVASCLILYAVLQIGLHRFVAESALGGHVRLFIFLGVLLNLVQTLLLYLAMSQPGGVRANVVSSLLSSAVYLAGLVLLVCVWRLGAIGGVLAYLASVTIRLLPLLSLLWPISQDGPEAGWTGLFKPLYGYGLSSCLSNLVTSSVFRMDVFILGSLAGVAAVGVYSVSVALAELALMVPNALGTSLFTHLPAATLEQQRDIICRSSRIMLFLGCLAGAALLVASYPLVVLLMGRKFVSSVVPLCLLVPGVVVMSLNFVFSNYFSARGRPLVTALIFGLGLVANFVCNLILIPLLKVSGASIASTVAYALITGGFLVLLVRREGLAIRDLLLLTSEDLVLIRTKLAQVLGHLKLRRA